ncbi:hypothetical protein M433DRAFT_156184 [Acidomyces richmondensis BFW]|nr:MAG: hypothetical protein FE78DRAFT_92828 [Acidomyces sp. 'richmondensis']KYG43927.1 hypothetical protein M433DRAFT_156184 [Acidomyces richmondensis BFW]
MPASLRNRTTNSSLKEPLKTYELIQPSLNAPQGRNCHLEVQNKGRHQLVYWTSKKHRAFRPAIIDIHAASGQEPVVSACKLRHCAKSFRFILGDPKRSKKGDTKLWNDVIWEAGLARSFRFRIPDRLSVQGEEKSVMYEWEQQTTYDHKVQQGIDVRKFSWGGSHTSFQLLDQDGNVLAVFTSTTNLTKGRDGKNMGRIDFLVEVANEVELGAVTVILGIAEQIRGSKSTEWRRCYLPPRM